MNLNARYGTIGSKNITPTHHSFELYLSISGLYGILIADNNNILTNIMATTTSKSTTRQRRHNMMIRPKRKPTTTLLCCIAAAASLASASSTSTTGSSLSHRISSSLSQNSRVLLQQQFQHDVVLPTTTTTTTKAINRHGRKLDGQYQADDYYINQGANANGGYDDDAANEAMAARDEANAAEGDDGYFNMDNVDFGEVSIMPVSCVN